MGRKRVACALAPATRHRLPATRLTGFEIRQVRAALGLLHHEFAAVPELIRLAASRTIRWSALEPEEPAR